MSRYCDGDGDEAFPGQVDLWRANADRALKGKRGRKVLADLREALLALPQQRLIASALCTVHPEKRRAEITNDTYGWMGLSFDEVVEAEGEGVCAIGAYLWHKEVKAGADPELAFDRLPLIWDGDNGDAMEETASAAKQAGVVFVLAWDLAYENDEGIGRSKTPEERHAAFLAWIDRELATA